MHRPKSISLDSYWGPSISIRHPHLTFQASTKLSRTRLNFGSAPMPAMKVVWFTILLYPYCRVFTHPLWTTKRNLQMEPWLLDHLMDIRYLFHPRTDCNWDWGVLSQYIPSCVVHAHNDILHRWSEMLVESVEPNDDVSLEGWASCAVRPRFNLWPAAQFAHSSTALLTEHRGILWFCYFQNERNRKPRIFKQSGSLRRRKTNRPDQYCESFPKTQELITIYDFSGMWDYPSAHPYLCSSSILGLRLHERPVDP